MHYPVRISVLWVPSVLQQPPLIAAHVDSAKKVKKILPAHLYDEQMSIFRAPNWTDQFDDADGPLIDGEYNGNHWILSILFSLVLPLM